MNNRRQFLKRVFGVATGAMVAPSVVKAKKKPIMIISPSVDISDLNVRPGNIQYHPLGTRRDGMIYVQAAENINIGDAVGRIDPNLMIRSLL